MKRKLTLNEFKQNKKINPQTRLFAEIRRYQDKFEAALQLHSQDRNFIAEMKEIFNFFLYHSGLTDDIKMSFFRISQYYERSLVWISCHPSLKKLADILFFFEKSTLPDEASLRLKEREINSGISYLLTHTLKLNNPIWTNNLLRCVRQQKQCDQEYKLFRSAEPPTTMLMLAFTQLAPPFIKNQSNGNWERPITSPQLHHLWKDIFMNALTKSSIENQLNVLELWIQQYANPRVYSGLFVEIKPLSLITRIEIQLFHTLLQSMAINHLSQLANIFHQTFIFPESLSLTQKNISNIEIFQSNTESPLNYGTFIFVFSISSQQGLITELFLNPTLLASIQWSTILYNHPFKLQIKAHFSHYTYSGKNLVVFFYNYSRIVFKKFLNIFDKSPALYNSFFKIFQSAKGFSETNLMICDTMINFPRVFPLENLTIGKDNKIIKCLQAIRLDLLTTSWINLCIPKVLFDIILGYLDNPQVYSFQDKVSANLYCFQYPPAPAPSVSVNKPNKLPQQLEFKGNR